VITLENHDIISGIAILSSIEGFLAFEKSFHSRKKKWEFYES